MNERAPNFRAARKIIGTGQETVVAIFNLSVRAALPLRAPRGLVVEGELVGIGQRGLRKLAFVMMMAMMMLMAMPDALG